MGALATGNFDNDDALDWIAELEDGGGVDLVASTLSEVALVSEDDYVEADQASRALAAAEVVALSIMSAQEKRTTSVAGEEEVAARVAALDLEFDAEIVALARQTVARVRSSSELNELWAEGEHGEAWQAIMEDLNQRLGSPR